MRMKPLLFAVFGRNVSASLSPRIHAAAAEALGYSITYRAISVSEGRTFEDAIEGFRVEGGHGANVTLPFKADAYRFASELSETAERIGVVNTLEFRADGVWGDNTDGPGLARRLEGRDLSVVRILGSGGAARAALWAATDMGAGYVEVAARRRDAAEALGVPGVVLSSASGAAGPPTTVISTLPASASASASRAFDDARKPFVLDAAYVSSATETPLTAAVRSEGMAAEDGRAMLVEQGALAFAAWTGANLDSVREAMHSALGTQIR